MRSELNIRTKDMFTNLCFNMNVRHRSFRSVVESEFYGNHASRINARTTGKLVRRR